MLDVLTLAQEDTQLHKASVHEQAGPCPDINCRCQHDGFRVRWNGEDWRFMCRGCYDAQEFQADKGRKRGWGDAIDYLRHYRKMSFQAAKALVDGGQAEEKTPMTRPRIPVQARGYQSDDWQEAKSKDMHEYIAALWNADDPTGLEYARGRGLSDETIKKSRLGYSRHEGVPRLYIPSMNKKRYVAIYRRDLRPDVPKEERWKDAPGGTKSELYLADCLHLRKGLPVVLVEDAFSALSIWQEAGNLVNVVATGGSNCGKLVKWLARLALVPLVLIALDADESGDKEAQYWLDRLENAKRLRPVRKDANDMLQAGCDLRTWVTDALAPVIASEEPAPLDEPWVCADCGVDLHRDATAYYDEHGASYCGKHGPEAPPRTSHEAFLATVNALAVGLQESTGVVWNVTPIEAGYTLDEHVKWLAEENHEQEALARARNRRRIQAA